MASFNLDDYETVEERIKRFYDDNPEGRITTEYLTTEADRVRAQWIVKASVFMDHLEEFPKATGLAFEIDGAGMANKTSALENAETSAIGRALANAGYSGNKRASREEMQKVANAAAAENWTAQLDKLTDADSLRALWKAARDGNAPSTVLAAIEAKAAKLGN